MDFLANIDLPFGVIFILALLWVVGIGALIVRKNKSIPKNTQTFYKPSTLEEINEQCGLGPGGQMINPFDVRLDRQLDLGPPIEDDFLEYLRNDDYHRNGH